jgi:rubrerythrin
MPPPPKMYRCDKCDHILYQDELKVKDGALVACPLCGRGFEDDDNKFKCPKCGGTVTCVSMDLKIHY